jgi:hypothetical protein
MQEFDILKLIWLSLILSFRETVASGASETDIEK